ncbi:uncharacterized protein LOC143291709 isoform X1 [Babylonia areolata]|uniref:uncharacterized protein LOC143291709 isoform X1 n=1 Tax=Babylonia areolata TaxID=304850 RepID=UPI003FD12B0E
MQPRTPPSEPRSGSDALNTNNDVHDGFHTSTKSTRDTGVEPQSTSQPANGPQQNSDRDNDRAEDDDDDSWLRHQGSDVMDVVNGSDENDSDSYYPPSSSSFHGEVNVEARKPSDREDSSDFVDMDTQQRADPLCLYSFRVRPELCRPTGQQIPPSELVEELQKNHESGKRSELRKHVPGTLRKLEQDKDWPAIARFLRVDSERALAMEKLQTLLMDLRTSQDSTMRDQLLEVDTITKAVILDLVSDSPDLLPMLTLHLMTLSAITSRCPKPQSHQYALGKAMSKPKGGSEGRKQVVLRVVHAFHEGVDKAMDQAGSFRDLAQGLLQHTDRGKWKTVFARASFCETVVNIFSLLNEVKHHGWNKQGEVLLQILHDAYGDGGFGRPSKAKLGEECNGALDLSLVRQMVLLLKTTFEEDRPQIDSVNCEHQELITKLLVNIADNANTIVRESILEEMKCLSYHKAKYVCQIFNCFWRKHKPPSVLAQGYLVKILQKIDFQQDPLNSSHSSEDQIKTHEHCSWTKRACTVDQKHAELTMYIPKASCQAADDLKNCLREHGGCESKRYIKNLDMLKLLSPRCRNIIDLHAYQFLPFPVYITEKVSHHRLLNLLLAHRRAEKWLPESTMRETCSQVISAFIFLSKQNIDPCGVTCYNTMVLPESETSGSLCSVLTSKGFTVKLTDLGLAHQFRDDDPVDSTEKIRPVDDQSPVPGRWLSDEALFQGKYGDPNMVFNTGTFTYEVYTLGAHPFASYDHTMTYEEILMKRMTQPGSTELANPPCIPREVHKLIRQCTHHNPDMRPQLSSLPDRLQKSSVSERKDEREPGLERVLSLKKRYPEISKSQEGRKHVPETGIPNSVQDALLAGKKSDLYNKARQSSVQRPGKKNVVKESELTPKDWIHISHQDERTVVEEVVSSEFVSDVLPTLRACDLNGVTCFSHNDDVRTRIDRRNGETVHQRVYDAATVSLENAARSHCLWEKEDVQSFFSGYDVEDDGQHMRVLVLLISLIRTVRDLHKKGWIARDLREESILVDKSTNEVILARIGRMHRLPSTDSYFVDEVPKDSFRRLGPEVLVSGRYGRENDVFQLGTLILQLYRILAITQNSPSAERRDFAPCPSYPAEKLANYIRDPNREEEPLELCPGWLKELSDRCRHADPEKRPTASQLLDSLESHQRDPVTLSVGKDSQIADPHHTGPAQQGMTSNVQPRRRQLSARQLARPRSRSKSPLRNFTTRPRRRSIWRTMKARFTRKKTNRKQRGTFTNGVVSEETEVEVNWSDGHVSDNSSDSGSPVELQCGDMIPDPDQTLLKTVYHDCQSSYDPLSSTTVAGLQSVDKTNNCDVTVPKIKASKNDSLLFPSEMTTNQLERTRAQSVATPCAGFPKERLRLASPVRTDRHSSFFTSSTFLAECAPQTSRQHHVPSRGNTHGSAHVLYYRFPTRGSHDKNTQPGTLSLFPIHLPSPRGQNLNPYDPGDDKTASDDDSSLRGTGTDISTEDNKQSDVGIEPSACVRPDKTTTIPSDREMSTNTWSGLGRTAGSDQDTHKKTHFQHSNSEKTQLRQSDSNIVHLTPHHGKTLPSSEDPLSHEENIGNAAKRKTRHTRNQFDPKENLENADSSSPKQEDSAVTAQAEYTNNEAIRADCKDDRCDVYANEVETWKVLRSGPVSSDYQMSHDTDVDEESDIHMNEESLTMKPVASTQTKRDPSSPLPPIPHSDNATYSRLSQNRLLPASGRPAPHSRTVHCVTQSVCQRASALGQTDTAALKRTSDHQSVTTRSITPTVVQSGSSTQHATTTLAPKGKRGNADSSGPKREEETDTKGEGSKQEMGRQFSSNRKSEMETISGDSHADEDNIYMNEGDSCQKVCDVHTELDPDNAPDSESVQQGKTSISEETQCNGPSDHPETQRSVACTRTGRNRMSSIPLIPNNVHVEHSGLAQSRSLSASKRPTSRSAAVSNMTQSVSQRASALGQRDTAALKRTSDHQSVTTSSITPTVVQSGSSTQHATTTLAPKGKRGNADSSAPKREEETDTKGEGSKQEMGRQFSSNRKLRMVPTTTGPIDTAISAQAEYTNSEAILVDHKDDHCGMYANEAETNGFTDSEQKTLTVIPAIDIVYRSDPMSGDCQMAHDSDPGEENGTYMNNVDVGSSSFAQSQSLSTSERPFSLSGTIQCLMESRPHLDVTTSSVTDHDQRSATNEATDRDNSSHQTSTESNRQDTVYEVSSLPMRPDDHMYSDLFSADSS